MRLSGQPLRQDEVVADKEKLFPSNESLNKPLVNSQDLKKVLAQPSTKKLVIFKLLNNCYESGINSLIIYY